MPKSSKANTERRVKEAPTLRAIKVYEAIVQHSPVKLEQLVSLSGIPKTALHRICGQLVQAGWINRRVSDFAYMPTERVLDLAENIRAMPQEISSVQSILQDWKRAQVFHVTVTVLNAASVLMDVESTKPIDNLTVERSAILSPVGQVMQSVMDKVNRAKFLQKHIKKATPDEVAFLESGQGVRVVNRLAGSDFLLDKSLPGLFFAFKMPSGSVLGFSVEPVRLTQKAALKFIDMADEAYEEIAGKLLSALKRHNFA